MTAHWGIVGGGPLGMTLAHRLRGRGRRVTLLEAGADLGGWTRLVWHKLRCRCPNPTCGVVTFTETDSRIADRAAAITDRAGRWATEQVGRHGRSVAEVADDLGCDWHTVMDAVNRHGRPLIDDPNRIGTTTAVGLDEVLFCRLGKYRHRCWSTQIVDVEHGQLLDIVAGRDAAGPCAWFAEHDPGWLAQIRWATLDLSGPYRAVFDTMLPHAVQIADPFHLIKLANQALDETGLRRVEGCSAGGASL